MVNLALHYTRQQAIDFLTEFACDGEKQSEKNINKRG